jgi:hypothetical protein
MAASARLDQGQSLPGAGADLSAVTASIWAMLTPPGIHVQWVEEEAVVLNEDTSELHYLNPQSALIYALLLEYGMPDAVPHACEHIDAPPEETKREVENLVDTLLDKGLLLKADD